MGNMTDRTDTPQDAKDLDQLRQGASRAKEELAKGRIEDTPEPEEKPKPKTKVKRRKMTK